MPPGNGSGSAPRETPGAATGPGLILVLLAATTWGTTGATMVLVSRRSPLGPLAVGFFRLAVAAPLLLALAGLAGAFARMRVRPHLPRLALMGAAMAAYQVGYFAAVPRTGVAATALLAICTSPLLIAGLATWLLGERLTARVALAMGAGIAGTALLVGGRFSFPGASMAAAAAGVVLALGAALAYAVYVVLAKTLVRKLPPFTITGVSFSLAAAQLSPVLMGEPDVWAAIRPVWPHLAYLGIVPTALAYALYILGLRKTSATAASICALLEPLTATLLGVAIFGESLGATGLVGAILLVGAVTLLCL